MLIKSTARQKYLSIPPRKMRLVADTVKGLPVEKALNVLNFTPKIAAHHLAKTVKSAAANALSSEGTDHLKPEDLMIKNIIVDSAPTAKRIRFQSMGRVFRYRKRFCHLTVLLEGEMDVPVDARTAKARAKKAEKVEAETEEKEKPKAASTRKPRKKTAAATGEKKAKTASASKTTKAKKVTKSKKTKKEKESEKE